LESQQRFDDGISREEEFGYPVCEEGFVWAMSLFAWRIFRGVCFSFQVQKE
jgi:hypothetical protein